MDHMKKNIYLILNAIYLVITILFDAFVYQRLPETIKTQFGFRGGAVNTMPKFTYMLITVGILLLLFVMGNRKDKMVQIKFIAISTIIVIANIIMLALQI